MLDDVKTEFDWVGHITADASTLSRELRLSEPDEEFVNRLLFAIVGSVTEIAELRQANADRVRREAWELRNKGAN
jgi:hypothetical protein